jgi:hypothetical protein
VLHLAACQTSAAWRPVPFEIVVGGEVLRRQSATREAVIGTAVSVLRPGVNTVFDRLNCVDVELADAEHWLESRDDAALIDGANLAMLGSELIQFGSAVPIGERLSV